jgi:hypothetical protein
MPIYTLCSTDPDNYGELTVSIPFYNSERVCEVTVLSCCTVFNVELLSEGDFIDILVAGQVHKLTAVATCQLSLEGICSYLNTRFEEMGLPNMKANLLSTNTIQFEYHQEFTILNMSYNFQIATGFYYINDNAGKNNFPITATKFDENEYVINVKACPFVASTPVLYLLSNTGGNCYRMNLEQDTLQTGTICMIINNSFNPGLPAISQQADITTRVYSSDLTFMRISLCDCNLHTIRLLNPIFVALSINEIPETYATDPQLTRSPVWAQTYILFASGDIS